MKIKTPVGKPAGVFFMAYMISPEVCGDRAPGARQSAQATRHQVRLGTIRSHLRTRALEPRIHTRDLDELGIEHEAEEFRGLPWDKYWSDDGRAYTKVLPFIARRLTF